MEAKKKLSPFAGVKQDDVHLVKKVAELIRKKDYSKAFVKLNDLVGIYPDLARLYSLRAMCASKQGGHKVAIKDAKKALELDETDAQAYCTCLSVFLEALE